MLKHLQLLGVLYFVWGGVFVLLGISLLALALGTAALVPAAEAGGSLAAGLAAATFASLAGVTMIWGLVHGWDGVALRRHRESGRAVAMVLSVLNLLVLPFGTALGIYALWVLTQDEIRPLFEGPRT
jgi:hypothetical protein